MKTYSDNIVDATVVNTLNGNIITLESQVRSLATITKNQQLINEQLNKRLNLTWVLGLVASTIALISLWF